MKRIIIAPDSFKGTLSAIEVCNIIAGEAKNFALRRNLYVYPCPTGAKVCAPPISPS